jgi:enediyne biosynthesis protein E4
MRTLRRLIGMLAVAFPLAAQTPSDKVPKLVDVTALTGIHFTHLSSADQAYIVESMSGGVALLDYDGDGWLDIYFTNAPSVAMALKGEKAKSLLYRNNHDGTFTDVTDKAGVGYPCWAMGAVVGDVDNDNSPDLVVSCFGGVVLYRNNGNGTFTDVTVKAKLDQDNGWATGVAFGDYDGDGWPDLFVPHYVDFHLDDLPKFGSSKTCQYHNVAVQCGPRGLKGSPDTLYHNNHDGTFTEVAAQVGVDDPKRYFGLGSVWSDFDNDGRVDLFVANDGEANFLYHNEGDGHLKEVGYDAGVAVSEDGIEQANMGLAVGDFEKKDRMSVGVSHFSDEYMTLYRNEGGLNFTEVAHATGVARATEKYVGWGTSFADLDNSGELDLLLVNGHVYPQVEQAGLGIHYREPGLIFLHASDGRFLEATAAVSPDFAQPQVSRGLAVGDLFHKGGVDVVVENLEGGPHVFSSQPNPAHHWFSVQLEGAALNRLALNVRVRVTTGGHTQVSEARSGGSYLSQSDLRLHFGLGDVATIDTVQVDWPGGSQTFHGVKADAYYHLRQGGTLQTVTFSVKK